MSWSVRLSEAADADLADIVAWTVERFGPRQARAYAEVLKAAILALHQGPSLPGVRSRNEIANGLFSLHVAREGRKGRHFLMFRIKDGEMKIIEVVRILHDAMDFSLHLP